MIDFLVEMQYCTVNGRVGTTDYTCISGAGASEVDYVLVPLEKFHLVKSCLVERTTEIRCDSGIQSLLGKNLRLPDHSLITFEVNVSEYSIENLDKSLGAKQHRLKKMIHKLPEDFMTGAGVQDLLAKWVKEMESVKAVIEDVDKLYGK